MIISRIRQWLFLAICEKRRAEGVRLYLQNPYGTEHVVAQVSAALAMLRRYAPRSFARLRTSMRGIAVTEGTASGYWRASRVVLLTESAVRSGSTEYVASGLVHEVVHDRIARLAGRITLRDRWRVEQLCLAQQIEFVKTLDPSSSLLDHLHGFRTQRWW